MNQGKLQLKMVCMQQNGLSFVVLNDAFYVPLEKNWGHALWSVYGHTLSLAESCTGLKFRDRVSPQLWNLVTLILPIKSTCWLPLKKISEFIESGFCIHHIAKQLSVLCIHLPHSAKSGNGKAEIVNWQWRHSGFPIYRKFMEYKAQIGYNYEL